MITAFPRRRHRRDRLPRLLLSGCVAKADLAEASFTVSSTADACTVSSTNAQSGTLTFDVKNEGEQVTEFYLLADDGLAHWSARWRTSLPGHPAPPSRPSPGDDVGRADVGDGVVSFGLHRGAG